MTVAILTILPLFFVLKIGGYFFGKGARAISAVLDTRRFG